MNHLQVIRYLLLINLWYLVMALNETQRNILEGTLKFPFDEIKEFTFADQTTFQDGIDNEKALTALQLILADNITPSQQAKLVEWDVWEGGVEQFRRILNHPAPQNRVRDPFGGLHDNQEGLLGLTARNDATVETITREDVVQYITQEVTNRIEAMQSQNIEPVIIEEVEGLNFQPAAVDLPIGYLPQQAQQIGAELLGNLQGIVSPAQLMGASPEFRGAIVGNNNVTVFLRDTDATFDQVSQIYDQSPEKFEQITKSDVTVFLRDTDATFDQVSQIYDQSHEKFEQITKSDVTVFLRDTDATFDQVSQIYDQSPEKFEQVTKTDVYFLLRDTDATFDQVSQIYDQPPEKFEQVTKTDVYFLLRDTDATFDQVSQIYDQSPEALQGITSSAVRRLPPEEFQTRLSEALLPQQPSSSVSSPRLEQSLDDNQQQNGH